MRWRGRLRPLRLHRLALVRLLRRWPTSLALATALAAATALPVAVTATEAATADAGLQDTVHSLGPTRYLRIDEGNVADRLFYTAAVQFTTTRGVSNTLGSLMRLRSQSLHTDRLYVGDTGGRAATSTASLTDIGLDSHVTYVQGGLPTEPKTGGLWNVTAPAAAVHTLGLQLGQPACLYFPTNSPPPLLVACVRLVGVWQARNPSDHYWAERPVPDDILTAPDLFGFIQEVRARAPTFAAIATFLYEPDLSRLSQRTASQVLAGFRNLRSGIQFRLLRTLVITDFDTAIQTFEDRLTLATFAVQLVAAQVLVVALLAVTFIAGHSLDRQRQLFAVWRSRGWSWLTVWRLLLVETLLLSFLAAPLGVLLGGLAAAAATRLTYGRPVPLTGGLTPDRLAPAAAVGLATAIAVIALQAAAASRRELLDLSRERSRPASRGWWQWRFLDLGLAAAGLALFGATRLLESSPAGAGSGSEGALTLSLPALALGLVGLASLRLLPLAAVLGRAGLSGALAAVQLRRRPVQHAGLALVVVLTVALGVLASIYATTAPNAAADRAAYATGADLRFNMSGDRPALDQVVAGLGGVQASSFALRTNATSAIGSPFQPTLLAVDPYTFRDVAWSRPDFAARPLADEIQALATRDRSGLALPGQPGRFGIWASSSGFAARLVANVTDAAGVPGRAVLGGLDFTGWRHLEADLTWPAGHVTYPLRLRDLAVEPMTDAATGSLSLSEPAVAQPGNSAWEVVDELPLGDRNMSAWWSAPGPGSENGLAGIPHAAPDGGTAITVEYAPFDGTLLLAPKPGSEPIPALAPASTLARIGIRAGQPFSLITNSVTATFVVVGTVDHFPTFYPEAEDFLVVAQAPLLAAIDYAGTAMWPAEAWLRTSGGADAADVAALAGRADVTNVESRRQAEDRARRDPVLVELRGNLGLGFGVATALTVIAVGLHFLVAVHDRHGEYAILSANGLGRRLIARSLALEQALLVAFGAVVGAFLGVALSWALVPALQIGADITAIVPPTLLSIDPRLTGGAALAVTVLALVAGGLASRAGGRLRLMDELRALG